MHLPARLVLLPAEGWVREVLSRDVVGGNDATLGRFVVADLVMVVVDGGWLCCSDGQVGVR